jgi:DNA-binding transcriptional ArsR family regulator
MAVISEPRLALRAKLFRGLSDVSRLALLEALRTGEKTVTELVTETGLTQSNVSGHLACLRDCGLVDSRQEWRHVYYRLADERLGDILHAAEAILAANAERIYACLSIDEGSEACS